MNETIREQFEQIEEASLSTQAVKSRMSKGRMRPEAQDPIRTCFQRDRDRVIHCKSFRRMKNKTQVFIDPEEDHYRTRLTHTLEVTQIARTISRALRLNEDLTEAIALAHDLGHPPFGHAGEQAMDEVMREFSPNAQFHHVLQSLRIVDFLENEGKGLNLTLEVREGIAYHSKGTGDLVDNDRDKMPSMEAAVVRVADRVAYVNHDLDDAIRAGALSLSDVPQNIISSLGKTHSERIATMAGDIIRASMELSNIVMSEDIRSKMDRLKDLLFEKVYIGFLPTQRDLLKAKNLLKALFRHYMQNPEQLPNTFQPVGTSDVSLIENVRDYIAGMTDRYAVQRFEELFLPGI
ncbi:MAG: deoxyguanosinetriphosphate triphosphohydrolase [bacterium]